MIGIGEEVYVHAANSPSAKLDVTRARPRVGHRGLAIPEAGDQCGGDGVRRTLCEDNGFRRSLQ